VKKTLKMRLLYIIAAVTMLAMLVPAMAAPVSAASGDYLVMTTAGNAPTDPPTNTDDGYNVTNTIVRISAVASDGVTPVLNVDHWNIVDQVNPTTNHVVTATAADKSWIEVQGVWGETLITATLADSSVLYNDAGDPIDKKWGQILSTAFDKNHQNKTIIWNEAIKEFEGSVTIKDTVTGDFIDKDGVHSTHVTQGVKLNWYLIAPYETIPMGPAEANGPTGLKALIAALDRPPFIQFAPDDSDDTDIQTITGPDGSNTVEIFPDYPGAAKVVVVPEYPGNPQLPVETEVATVNFEMREMEVVPQIRWAGEKIVLEKNFFNGAPPANFFVRFTATGNSKASLEPYGGIPAGYTGVVQDGQTVDAVIDPVTGFASVILYCPVQGCIDVSATLYQIVQGTAELVDHNQHHFSVYYLKFDTLTLGNVIGKRVDHNAGLWVPENPWDPAGTYVDPPTPDNTTVEALNVSQDALLRARVTGYFNDDEGNKVILPDAWPLLADEQWQLTNIHWDIMNDPSKYIIGDFGGTNMTTKNTMANTSALVAADDCNANGDEGLGPYYKPYKVKNPKVPLPPLFQYQWVYGIKVAENPVIGPFTPGVEQPAADMTLGKPAYAVPNNRLDTLRANQTVVPDGLLNWWDAPMPAAKITFEVTNPSGTPLKNQAGNIVAQDKAGFFKEAFKKNIYYGWWFDDTLANPTAVKIFTNPFYQVNIPAHWAIPPILNNGGYDWDSFGKTAEAPNHTPFGPYEFWTITNRQTENYLVPSDDPTNHPTLVQVYSDNHGEAMVYINGDWNLALGMVTSGGTTPGYQPFDIKPGTTVGTSTIQAIASYPYVRQPSATYRSISSATIEKDWLWGKRILGPDPKYKDLLAVPPIDNSYPNGDVDDPPDPLNATSSTRMVLQTNLSYGAALGTTSNFKLAMLWVTDRDGQAPVGEKVNWDMQGSVIQFAHLYSGSVSSYNEIMQVITVTDGFLTGTNGVTTDTVNYNNGVSYLRSINPAPGMATCLPNDPLNWASIDNALAAVFYKFYNGTKDPLGLQPKDFAVAGVLLNSSVQEKTNLWVTTEEREGNILRDYEIDFAFADAPDDPLILGDVNYDGTINMGDVILTERMMLGLNQIMTAADFNLDGKVNIADIIGMERAMLGL